MTIESLPQGSITIACAQAQSVAGNVQANVRLVVEMIAEAAVAGAGLVLFPEKFLSGYEPDLIRADPSRHAVCGSGDPRIEPILTACRQHRICAIVGAATLDEADRLRVSSLIVDAGGHLRGCYHKQFLFSSERAIYQPGETGVILELSDWRFGLAICYDTGFAEHARAAALKGCHVYLASALFSQGNGAHELSIWFPARALDNTMFVALSNHVGTTGGWKACGGSAIWSPYGHCLTEGSPDQPAVVMARLDPDQLRDARGKETMLADIRPERIAPSERSFDVIRLDPGLG
jgi:predicted amidohydrolase